MFLGGNKFVNAYVERDKKNLKLAVFGVQVAAFLIENLTQIVQITQINAVDVLEGICPQTKIS